MKRYDIKIRLDIETHFNQTAPKILFGIDNKILLQYDLKNNRQFLFEETLNYGNHRFFLKLTNSDPNKNNDTAIKIKHISFQNFKDNFHYFSKYKPEYPIKWLEEQKNIGKEWPETILSNYIGWNGIYYIDFETPIYRWIHKKLNLGWLI